MKTIEVVAAIIVREGEVFCTQRGYGEWQGWWEFHDFELFVKFDECRFSLRPAHQQADKHCQCSE